MEVIRRRGVTGGIKAITCPAGRKLLKQKITGPSQRLHGHCENCGAGPLHGVLLCLCSCLRNNRRICRDCAAGYDLMTIGHTPFFTSEQNIVVAKAMSLMARWPQ